jgi:hypothetical protein
MEIAQTTIPTASKAYSRGIPEVPLWREGVLECVGLSGRSVLAAVAPSAGYVGRSAWLRQSSGRVVL